MRLTLETKRLILRKPVRSDWKDIQEGFDDESTSNYFESTPYPYTEKDAKLFVKNNINKWKDKKARNFIFFIELKSEKKVMGVAYLFDINYFSGTASFGAWINKKYRKKHYLTEVTIAINDLAFLDLDLRKINTKTFSTNPTTKGYLKKFNYVSEGIEKKQVKCRSTGKIHDYLLFALFKETWIKNKSRIKKELGEELKKLS